MNGQPHVNGGLTASGSGPSPLYPHHHLHHPLPHHPHSLPHPSPVNGGGSHHPSAAAAAAHLFGGNVGGSGGGISSRAGGGGATVLDRHATISPGASSLTGKLWGTVFQTRTKNVHL